MPLHRKPKPVQIPADESQVGQLDNIVANWVAAGDAAKAWFASNAYFTQQAASQKTAAQQAARTAYLKSVNHQTLGAVGDGGGKVAMDAALKNGKTQAEAAQAYNAASAAAQTAYKATHDKNMADANAAAQAATSSTAEQLAVAAFQQHHGKFSTIKDTTLDELNAAGEVLGGLVK